MANNYLSKDKGLLVSEEDELVDITSKIQYEVLKNNIDIVFIDYINLVNITGSNKEEHQKITECTRSVSYTHLEAPTFALSLM